MAIKYFSILVIVNLLGTSLGENVIKNQLKESNNLKRSPEPQYGNNEKGQGAPVAASVVSQVQSDYLPQYYQSKAPTKYSNSIPAAAIRNVETVAVTKTITPVVTKTTTYKTHSEPALSIGHVQGYSNSAVGQAKIAPVQFLTQYTSYANPTVGVNGPVTYTGPAIVAAGGAGGAQALTLALAPVHGAGGSLGGAYGGAVGLTSAYGHSNSYDTASPYGSYAPPSYGSYHAAASQNSASQLSYGGRVAAVKVPSKPSYGKPLGEPLGSYSMNFISVMRPPAPGPAAAFHQPQYYYGGNPRQPVMTVVQTYAAPSITLTKHINKVN